MYSHIIFINETPPPTPPPAPSIVIGFMTLILEEYVHTMATLCNLRPEAGLITTQKSMQDAPEMNIPPLIEVVLIGVHAFTEITGIVCHAALQTMT